MTISARTPHRPGCRRGGACPSRWYAPSFFCGSADLLRPHSFPWGKLSPQATDEGREALKHSLACSAKRNCSPALIRPAALATCPYPLCPFGTFPPDRGDRPQGEGMGCIPHRRCVGDSAMSAYLFTIPGYYKTPVLLFRRTGVLYPIQSLLKILKISSISSISSLMTGLAFSPAAV